jgi:starch-binding outer membrane protein, SusD/RagB family
MNKKYIITIVLVITTLLGGCKDWLDTKPADGITLDDYWKTKEQVNSAVVGCYSSMLDNSFITTLFNWGEVRGDLVTISSSTVPADNQNFWKFQLVPQNSLCNWSTVYKTINYCNLVLQFAPGAQATDPSFTTEELKAYEAEALGIRALMYFYLVRTFGDVPLRLEATSTDNSNFVLRKTGQDTIYTQILADLDTAEKYIPKSYSTVAETKGRITKYAIWAMQAEVHLWLADTNRTADYASCISACDNIINSGQYGLVGQGSIDPAVWFNTLFVVGNSNESIFELQFSAQKTNPFSDFLSLTLGTSTKYYKASSTVTVNLFMAYDVVNQDSILDYRAAGATFGGADGSIWKYIGLSSSVERTQAQSYAHWIFYRLADVYLMKAEALAQTGEIQKALDILTLIRQRGHASGASLPVSASDITSVSDFVLAERGRELAFEGKRWFDLLRMAKRDNFAQLDNVIATVLAKVPSYLQVSTQNKLHDTRSLYLPIPQSDILNSKGALVQNSFYQ